MSNPKTKPAETIAAEGQPKPPAKYAWQAKDIGQQIRAGIKQELKRYFDQFLESGRAEEIQFMWQIFFEHDCRGASGFPKGLHDYEVPLFSAIESAITSDSRKVISLPREAMLNPVSDFIEDLEKAAETNPEVLKDRPSTRSDIRAHWETDLKRFIDMFCTEATNDDLFFLHTVLARRADIMEYNPEDQPESPIAAAFQHEIDRNMSLVKIPYRGGPCVEKLVRILLQKSWLSDLLNWILDQGADRLSPWMVASKAAGMRDEWERAKAAQPDAS